MHNRFIQIRQLSRVDGFMFFFLSVSFFLFFTLVCLTVEKEIKIGKYNKK